MEALRSRFGVKIGAPRILGAIIALALLAALVLALMTTGLIDLLVNRNAEPTQIALGRSVYATRCAGCHGKNLEGQPNWKTPLPSGRLPAPPHDSSGHTWHHSDRVLIGVTKNGLKPYAGDDYESDMPAFDGQLTGEEIESVIAYIKSTWPKRERQYQERINAQNQAPQ